MNRPVIENSASAAAAPRRSPPSANSVFDMSLLRRDFPILQTQVRGKPLVYLDNAATSQKPNAVIAAITRYYSHQNANIHRGVYKLSAEATTAYENAREKIARFIDAPAAEEIVFVRGCTEGINLVAHSWGLGNLRAGDEILLSGMEHHSNIVPWQLAAERTGAKIIPVPFKQNGELDMGRLAELLSSRTRIVAITHISNALGTINPIQQITAMAHEHGALVLVDAAQSVPHMAISARRIGCDFMAFSGHKMFGPTGIGAVWARKSLWDAMPPYQSGGDMIRTVTFEKSTWNQVPHKFEAGTPDICGAIALGAAVDYLTAVGMENIESAEQDLLAYAQQKLLSIDGLSIVGTAAQKAAVVSFTMKGIHPHDIGTIVDEEGVAIRTGHHCCQPVMDFYGIPATARASLAFYNTREDIDRLAAALEKVKEVFA